MGITRYAVECPGCEAKVLLRLGVGHEKRQPFFYICPKCKAATRGALIWNGGIGTGLEVAEGRVLKSEEGCTGVVSINPEIPAMPNTWSMNDPGGSAFLTFTAWVTPQRTMVYQNALSMFRERIDKDWGSIARLTTYYLNRDWTHFNLAISKFLPAADRKRLTGWRRDDAIHHIYQVFFGPLWVLPAEKDYVDWKTAFNKLWNPALNRLTELSAFAQQEARTPRLLDIQRDLFSHLAKYVQHFGGLLPGLLCDQLPEEHQPRVDELRIFRDEFEVLRDFYIQSFETCHKSLRWIVGVKNTQRDGTSDAFPMLPGFTEKQRPKSLSAFDSLVNAERRKWLAVVPEWSARWDFYFDRHLRNDIGHASAHHELSTGLIHREGRDPLPYTRFLQQVHRMIIPLLACLNAVKVIQIYGNEYGRKSERRQ